MIVDAPLRILSVDNEPSVTTSLRYIFTGARYEFTCVEGGNEALAKLEADPDSFDVIIVDHKMPRLSGMELVCAIRERGIDSKVIVVSGDLSQEIREAYARMDVAGMFSKPFDIHLLRSAVDRLAA